MLLTSNLKFTRAFRGVKEAFVFVTTHMKAPDALYIRTPLGSTPKSLIFSECFYFVYIDKLIN